ncbi:MAG: DUF975 family protein [Clostridiales bacterium]|nr:DUF975 family protein [Clostridiales bacterium]
MSRKQIKNIARHNLLGHYRCAIGALILVGIASIIASYFASLMTAGRVGSLLVGIVGYILFLIVGILTQVGYEYVQLRLARGQQAIARDVFLVFRNHPGRFIGYEILVIVVCLICIAPGIIVMVLASIRPVLVGRANIPAFIGVALLIVGVIIWIVIYLSWSMAVYCLLDQENLKVMDGIRNSRVLMRGNRGRLFVLELSFIGWVLFSVLTFFIGMLWIIPYIKQSLACFYISLLPASQQTYGSAGSQGYGSAGPRQDNGQPYQTYENEGSL